MRRTLLGMPSFHWVLPLSCGCVPILILYFKIFLTFLVNKNEILVDLSCNVKVYLKSQIPTIQIE